MIGHILLYGFYTLVCLGVCIGVFYGYAYLGAYSTVKTLPREAMFFCSIHGYMSKSAVITFYNVEYCPICYNASLGNAERIDG
jgi:hypothetical protein